ncbi:MAG: TIGR02757 family protein [Desulfobacteraceae bacterium]|jgi:uncharacterized protein (TIGR02757 family)
MTPATPNAFRNRFSPPLKTALDDLYRTYNRRCFACPDPLQFLYAYTDLRDREVAGLVASSLAYGRVAQILRSVSTALGVLGPSPFDFVMHASLSTLRSALAGFRHRFSTGEDIAGMLWAARLVIRRHGSLENGFLAGLRPEHETVLPALTSFVRALRSSGAGASFLLPQPEKGSACKRWHLYLRWMVRKDEVDPGGWDRVPPSMLIVPLDTHMHRIGLRLGGTTRKQADARAALEVTKSFLCIAPEDPVRYDFSLTRLGIRADTDLEGFLRRVREVACTPHASSPSPTRISERRAP